LKFLVLRLDLNGINQNQSSSQSAASPAQETTHHQAESSEAREEGEEHHEHEHHDEEGEGHEQQASRPVERSAERPAADTSSHSSPSPSAGGKPRWGGAPTEKCVKCGKTVYSAEMAKMEGQIWHDNCLRCVEEGCNKKLSGSNWGGFVPPNNAPYCKVHHQRLLQSSGSSIAFSGSTTASKWKIGKD